MWPGLGGLLGWGPGLGGAVQAAVSALPGGAPAAWAAERAGRAAVAARVVLQLDPARLSARREAVAHPPRPPAGEWDTSRRRAMVSPAKHPGVPSAFAQPAPGPQPRASCARLALLGASETLHPPIPPSFLRSAVLLPAQSLPSIAMTLSFFCATSPSFDGLCTHPTPGLFGPTQSSFAEFPSPSLSQFFTPGDPLRVGLAAALERALSWVMRTDLPGTTIFHPSPQTR